ncbi:putative protein kinase ArgK-like GTPase of G3E family [Arthrobacter pascens]|nr:GTPase domain-containing protein [Arthrobacter pascens]MDQ0677984.1 putative protein kinase ArgK-like GTPase of G3E family [Arthrobacter pascens]
MVPSRTLVVLNQVDRPPERDVRQVLDSLRGILARDGLAKVRVLATSALTGAGVDAVLAAIRKVGVQRKAQSERLAADITMASQELRKASGDGEAAGVRAPAKTRLSAELAVAANVPVAVLSAVTPRRAEQDIAATGRGAGTARTDAAVCESRRPPVQEHPVPGGRPSAVPAGKAGTGCRCP